MNLQRDQNHAMGLTDFLTWRSNTAAATLPLVADEDLPADVDEPPDNHINQKAAQASFTKSSISFASNHKESLLTKAFQNGEHENYKPEGQVTIDLTRRRSMMSNASLASTAELTSDGGLTSPARTNTPSPPIPRATYTSFAPYSLPRKTNLLDSTTTLKAEPKDNDKSPSVVKESPKLQLPDAAAPTKRCITFMCDGNKGMSSKLTATSSMSSHDGPTSKAIVAPQPQQPRRCTIKFACPGPRPLDKLVKVEASTPPQPKSADALKQSKRSPSIPRKSPRPGSASRIHRESTSTVRRASQSPVAIRAKPKYIIADEKTIQSSEATRFHEFASEELQDDDWIRKDIEVPTKKLTINDTLKMENAIRRLGNEAEEEAMEEDEEEEEEEEEEEDANESDDEDGFDEEDDFDNSEEDASDGNETDNEAGFAESDDESDAGGEFAFWTPGKRLHENGEASTYRPSAHRAASVSSIDSLNHMELSNGRQKKPRRRPIKIRPGTPDLPDSTDFVCGTLDEDRPLEDAYVSCMEARKHARHKLTPQDIDPSFPTSDLEEEDENDVADPAHDSDEHVWLHGKFEESDDERHSRRRPTNGRHKSPQHSPRRIHSPAPLRRLHSPPPAKHRLRSPPPRKLFGNSPKRMRSPPPARMIRSPPASPTASSHAITFAPLGSRPGLTHTKSLPRTPNAFCRAYHASRLAAANGNDGNENNDGHVRGAIDIVKGLEQKRQRRREKFLQNRKNKGHTERRPQPGKGAERMRELGLLMAGKAGNTDPYMMSA